VLNQFRRLYGADPLHLLSFVAGGLISGAAVYGWFDSFVTSDSIRILIWFLGAAIAHDLVLLPIYSVLDRGALLGLRVHSLHPPSDPPAAPPHHRPPGWVYLRIPALFSGLIALVFFPEALRLGNTTFQIASGMTQDVYLSRLLLTCGAAFALSGLAYAISAGRRRRGGTGGPPPSERTTPGRHDAAAKKPVSPDTPAP